MHPLSDKDLDRLSREAADQFDVEQNTSGWDKLEQKLSKHMPEKGRKERRRFLFFIWLFVLLSGGGLVWMLTGNTPQSITLKEGSSRPTSADQVTSSIAPSPSSSQGTKSSRSNEDSGNRTTTKPASLPGQPAPVSADDGTGPSAEAKTPETGNGVLSSTGVSQVPQPGQEVKSITTRGRKANQRNDAPQFGLVKSIPQQKSNAEPLPAERKDETITNPKSTKEQVTSDSQQSPTVTGDQSKAEQKVTGNDNDVDVAKKVGEEQKSDLKPDKKSSIPKIGGGFNKGLSLSLVGAPDMSNVKFTNSDKVGFNVGALVGYRFSQKWSVSTGLLYTRKNYTAEGKDFNPPKGTWIDNVRLDEVEGYCKMYDIPVNIRYDLTNGNKHRYFVSTGLSSYLMKKEDYHYYYQYTNGSPGYRHRSGNSTARHWASIVNISAGFEQKIGRRFSLQAEPYFKIPLTGVGFGNLKLNSYGVYLSTRIDAKRGR